MFVPPATFVIDNGAMMAGAEYFPYQLRGGDPLTIEVRAIAPLGQLAIQYRPESKYKQGSAAEGEKRLQLPVQGSECLVGIRILIRLRSWVSDLLR